MSDDSPWKPPVGGDDHTPGQPAAEAPNVPASDPAPPTAPATAAPTAPLAAPDAALAAGETTELGEPTPAGAGGSRRSPWLLVGGVGAIVAVGLAAIFAVRGLTEDSPGGAASPEELADDFMAAIEGEDVLGLIDVFLPGERDSLGEPFVETIEELQRLEVLSSDLDLSAFAGIDIELGNPSVTVGQLGVPDIVMLDIRADVVATLDGAEVPLGELVTDRMPEDMLVELRGSSSTETDTLDASLAAVREDDRWYLSVFTTLAELIRTDEDAGPIPAEGIGAVGAESPEAAVDRLFDQFEELDVRGLIQGLDPAEAQALQRYAPLFLDDAEAAIAEAGSFEIRIVDREFRVDGGGSERTVFVDGLTIEAEVEGSQAVVAYADGCVRFEFSDDLGMEPFEQCGAGPDLGSLEETAGLAIPESVDAFIKRLAEAFSDMEPVGLELRERDGGWYVSPIASVTDAMLAGLRALDRTEIDELIDLGEVAFGEAADMVFGGSFGEEFTIVEETVAPEPEPDDAFGDSDDAFGDSDDEFGELSDEDPLASAVDHCYMLADATEAGACFEEAVASGAAEEWQVPSEFRVPECGLTESIWTGELYQLPDADFVATLAAAAPCYEEQVAAGLEEFDVPYEVAYLDCFEGRNPYLVYGDEAADEYQERVWACVSGNETDG